MLVCLGGGSLWFMVTFNPSSSVVRTYPAPYPWAKETTAQDLHHHFVAHFCTSSFSTSQRPPPPHPHPHLSEDGGAGSIPACPRAKASDQCLPSSSLQRALGRTVQPMGGFARQTLQHGEEAERRQRRRSARLGACVARPVQEREEE